LRLDTIAKKLDAVKKAEKMWTYQSVLKRLKAT